jgi:hypothetical protein
MVQRKEVPADFLTAWDRRRGREQPSTFGTDNAFSSDRTVDQAEETETETNQPESTQSMIVAIERTDFVNGWPLAVVERESIPLIEDEELGRRLGYADARMVRKLVRRIFNDSEVMYTVSQTPGGGRPATVFLLTRAQALKVAMRSETPNAVAIQDQIIAVYEAWLERRRLDQPASINMSAARLETFLASAASFLVMAEKRDSAIVATLNSIESRLSALEQTERPSKSRSGRPASKPRLPSAPPGWASHRAVAAEHGLPSAGPTGRIVEMICRATGVAGDPELARMAPHGSFNTSTLMLSPECIARLERALWAAHEAMHDYGYQVSDAKAFEPRREVRPLLSPTRVLAKMVAAARGRFGLAAAA